jgi:ketosteroid isomerase-like protein
MNLPKTAEDAHAALAAAYNTGDLDTVLNMYDVNGYFVATDGLPVSGKEKFSEIIKNILSIPGTMEIKTVYCLKAGDVAVGRSEWNITDNGEIRVAAKGIELMKQQPDGTWKVVVDHAIGAEASLVAR